MLRHFALSSVLSLAVWGVPAHALDKASPKPSPYSCSIEQIPTSWAFDNAPGEIEQNNAVFGELGQTTIDFHFRNREPSAIQALMLVMEYADGQGRIIDQVPVSAAVGDKPLDPSPNVLAPIHSWKRAVLPGASALMGADREGIRTGSCPVRARVTFARAQFTDGTVRTFSSPGWRVGPMPRAIPNLSETVPPVPADPPVSLRARVKISATGQLADILSDDQDQPKVLAWIKDRMRDWSFRPALLNGEASDSEFDALFLIHAKGEINFHESEPLLAPVTLIQFFWTHDLHPDSGGADRITVMYGFLPEGSQME
jgi:hypothetical protein